MILRPALLPALGVFAVAARHQNFAHAAEELHLTASAVSHHVRRLESLLGTVLFQRQARGVRLTAEGRQLADAAAAALSDLNAVAGNLHPQADIVPLRVTTLRSRFTRQHPRMRIELQTSSELLRFDENGPELGIRYGLGQWPGLTAHHLMDDELCPVASPALPGVSALREPVQIAGLPLVSDMSPQGWRDWFRAAGVRGLDLATPHVFSDSTDAMRAAVYGIGAVGWRKHKAQPKQHRN